jgi:tRNA nucleotidyltransferase (CCA-adding enzyme)
MKNSLDIISRERIRDEIDKLICGTNCLDVLLEYSDVISVVIPEFADCVGFDQRSDYHKYDVWEHIIRAMILSPPDNLLLRRALFFHDIGKPACATYDEQGKGHFKGHDTISADMTEIIMKRLKYDKKSIHDTAEIIRYHRFKGNTKPAVKKMLNILGDRLFFELIELKKCDNQAKNHFVRRENDDLDIASAVAHEILSSGECFSVSQLAVDGNDLIQHGVQGVEIGEMLDEILELVIDEKIPNDRTEILNFIRQR